MKNVPIELTKIHIAEPGWMPGHREILTVIDFWHEFTDGERATLMKRLAKMDAPATKVALNSLAALDDKSRCELVRPILKSSLHVMNFMNSPVSIGEVLGHCAKLLCDKNPRVRKAAAQAIGSSWSELKSGDRDLLVSNLMDALKSAVDPSERKALVDALGKSGHQKALDALRLNGNGDGKAVIQLNRDLAPRGNDQDCCVPEKFSGERPIVLWVLPGLDALVEELPFAKKLRRVQAGVFTTRELSWTEVNAVHLWHKAGFYLGESEDDNPTDLARLLANHSQGICSSTVRTEGAPVRVRLGRGNAVTRSFVWKFAEELQKLNVGIINDGRDAHWDLSFVGHAVVLAPKKILGSELPWRNSSVDGASSVALAAALVQLAAIKPGDKVYDPFCGAGTELILGFQSTPDALFVGSDINSDAVAAARKASQTANAKITFHHHDALSFTGGPFDVVITNPPFGMRTVRGGARQILESFLNTIRRKLTAKGRVVMLSHAPNSTRDWAKIGGLGLLKSVPVLLGRMPCELQVFSRTI